MKFKDRLILWLIGLSGLLFLIYSIRSILLPFAVAFITAYFLDPAADKLEKLGLSRLLATVIITILFFAVVIISGAVLAPIFYGQLLNFLNEVPSYVDYLHTTVAPAFAELLEKVGPDTLEKAKDSISGISAYALKFLGALMANLWNSGMAIINLFSLLFITPIVTFYMLRDWDIIIAKIDNLLPIKHARVIRTQVKEIDKTLSGYIRGQTHVCLIIGTFYAILLTAVGLNFGLFIGLATGFLLFIPYVGSLFGFTVGMLVAFFQFSGDTSHISMVATVFIIGQILESCFITPNLVGNNVGLHPVWIMFGLLAGGAMLGFLGVLIAVPVTAVIGVLIRFFLKEYLKARK